VASCRRKSDFRLHDTLQVCTAHLKRLHIDLASNDSHTNAWETYPLPAFNDTSELPAFKFSLSAPSRWHTVKESDGLQSV